MVKFMSELDLLEIIKKEVEKYEINKKKQNKITILGEDELLKNEIKKCFEIDEISSKLLVVNLEIDELVALSQGSYMNLKTQKIIEGILQGDEVYLVEEGLKWREYRSAPSKLIEKYLSYEEELKKYNVKILKKINCLEELKGEDKKEFFSKKLFTLRDAKEIHQKNKSTVVIDEKVFITESALDYIKENNINLIKR